MIERLISLDLQGEEGRGQVKRSGIIINQANYGSAVFAFKVTDGPNETDYTQFAEARITLAKSGQPGFYYDGPGELSEDGISLGLTKETLAHPGSVTGQLTLTGPEQILATLYFEFYVLKDLSAVTPSDKGVIVSEVSALVDELQKNAEAAGNAVEIAAQAQALLNQLKDNFSELETDPVFQEARPALALKSDVAAANDEIRADLDTLAARVTANEGGGGYVHYYDFGTAEPGQADITAYVKSQIWPGEESDHADTEIFNGTRVVNDFDGVTWVLANTPDTVPPVFEWEPAGNFSVSIATDTAAGLVTSSDEVLEVKVSGVTGKMSVNGLPEALAGKLGKTEQAADSAKLGSMPASVIMSMYDCLYPGYDLTERHAAEIAASPYNGDPWAWVRARIRAADYDGLHVGDYIPFALSNGENHKAEVAGIDTYYGYGDTAVGRHIDFISRDCYGEATHVWNRARYNNGLASEPSPWLASDMHAWLNGLAASVPNGTGADPETLAVDYTVTGVYPKLPQALKDVIALKRMYAPARYSAGILLTSDNGAAWKDLGPLWLPYEFEVTGSFLWGNTSQNVYSAIGATQYPIFAHSSKPRTKINAATMAGATWALASARAGSAQILCVYFQGFVTTLVDGATAGHRAPICFRIA